MTAQVPETLYFHGKGHSMCTEPLASFFDLVGWQPRFTSPHTGLWRGYVGTWELIDDRLYLTAVEGRLEDGTKVSLGTLFPGFENRVFAHWCSGALRVPRGERLRYVHGGYGSTFEEDVNILVEKGVVVRVDICRNERPDPEN